MNSSIVIKIGGVVLVIGVILFYVFFVMDTGRQEQILPIDDTQGQVNVPVQNPIVELPQEIEEGVDLKEERVEVEILPPTSSTPLTETDLDEDAPNQKSGEATELQPKEEAVAELPKCEYREHTIRIFSAYRAEPASLTIYVGDTVTLINEDNDLRWPGADPHPTHSSLLLFDALGGISTGQSYSHTFKTFGKYGWHDHILDDPPTLGFITVLPCD